ncbi:MAG: aminotransferase class V-fold PLP-dependent enzyme [Thaumarchaeota archaeon]|jgi:alanine-glyoxylate transaminase/serine-glyoxylate transaminase/serine-pyruvate transaminase|nr:aminotransferase class V-fold PLP-dependent enzyme [Nitrososphaerota archaeon]
MKKILMIPGPIEYEHDVLSAMAKPTYAHTSKEFAEIFKDALEKTMMVFDAKDGLPYAISGSGTLAMEISTANFIKKDSKILVVSTGYFGDRFVDLFSRFSKNVEVYRPPLGYSADPKEIYEKVSKGEYDLVTVTHVDTSSGVKNNIKEIAKFFRDLDTILVVDGVCSIGGEEFSMQWGVDVAFTASQKALGVPPGLAVGVVGAKALKFMEKNPPLTFYSDLRIWQNVLRTYMQGKAAYFATPAVNLILALDVSLNMIVKEGIDNRVKRHQIIAESIRAALKEIGLKFIPKEGSYANTISVQYLPENVKQSDFLADAERFGAVFAGGLIPEIKEKYFRIGHMGSITSSEVLIAIGAVERALKKNGYKIDLGRGLSAAQEVLYNSGY